MTVVWLNARRVFHIFRVVLVHAVAFAWSHLLARYPALGRVLPQPSLSGPARMRRLFEDLGGSFIKFGQMLALQPDIVSLEYCDELFNLLDRIPPFAPEHIDRIFQEELGRTPADIFSRFDRVPIATASIGQVHVAWLGDRKLAVKVQRPQVDVEFAGDVRLMTLTMKAIRRFKWQSLYWTLEPMGEFAAWTREELDYRREARYGERLRRNAVTNAREHVPEVLWDLTTRRTLVMEFMTGSTVLDYLRAMNAGDPNLPRELRLAGFEPDAFARHIIDNFLGDAFQYGCFHADLHPANLLVLPGNVVGYVDFGITGVLSRFSRRHLVGMTLAYTRGDIQGMADAFSKLTVADANYDPAGFREGLAEMSEDWYGEPMDGSAARSFKKNFTLVMLDMLTLSRKTGIWPERDVIKYIRSAIAVDGLITRFAPGFSVGRHLEAACARWMSWEARRAAMSYDTLVGWATSSGQLASNGAARAATILRRIADGEMTARIDLTTGDGASDDARRRVVRLAGVVVILLSLIDLTTTAARPGLNLFTVEAVLAGAAGLLLIWSLRSLARTD